MPSKRKDYKDIIESNPGVDVHVREITPKKAAAKLCISLPVLEGIARKDMHITKEIALKADQRHGIAVEDMSHELYKKCYFELRKYLRHISKEIFGMMPSTVKEDSRVGIVKKDAYDMPPGYNGPYYGVFFIAPVSRLKRKRTSNLAEGTSDNLVSAYEAAWVKLASIMHIDI